MTQTVESEREQVDAVGFCLSMGFVCISKISFIDWYNVLVKNIIKCGITCAESRQVHSNHCACLCFQFM